MSGDSFMFQSSPLTDQGSNGGTPGQFEPGFAMSGQKPAEDYYAGLGRWREVLNLRFRANREPKESSPGVRAEAESAG